MTDTIDLLPCPMCGNASPQVDEGPDRLMADAPFISCPTIHLFPGGDLACPVHAHGYENWNALASVRVEPDTPSPEAIVKAAMEGAAERAQRRWVLRMEHADRLYEMDYPEAKIDAKNVRAKADEAGGIAEEIRALASDPAEMAAILKAAGEDRG